MPIAHLSTGPQFPNQYGDIFPSIFTVLNIESININDIAGASTARKFLSRLFLSPIIPVMNALANGTMIAKIGI